MWFFNVDGLVVRAKPGYFAEISSSRKKLQTALFQEALTPSRLLKGDAATVWKFRLPFY